MNRGPSFQAGKWHQQQRHSKHRDLNPQSQGAPVQRKKRAQRTAKRPGPPVRKLRIVPHTLVSPGISKPRPGEKAALQLTVSVHVSPARNESYHYGRIRRKNAIRKCTHTHLIRSVAVSSRPARSTRIQSSGLPLLPPAPKAWGNVDKTHPGPGSGSKHLLLLGPPPAWAPHSYSFHLPYSELFSNLPQHHTHPAPRSSENLSPLLSTSSGVCALLESRWGNRFYFTNLLMCY